MSLLADGIDTEAPLARALVCLVNPRAGRRSDPSAQTLVNDRLRQQVEAALDQHPREPGLIEFHEQAADESLEAAIELAARRAAARSAALVVIGGDGTVNSAARAALTYALPLGIVPTGTFNFVARSHGIPETLPEAVDVLVSERPRPSRIARINGRPFLVNASIGLYAKLLNEREQLKHRLGRSRAVATLAATLTALRSHRPLTLRMENEGRHRTLSASTLIVGNNRLQLELIGIEDLPPPQAPALTCALLHPIGRLSLLAMIWRGWQGEVDETPELETFPIERLTVDLPKRRARRLIVAIDGELQRLQLPLEFSVSTTPLTLIRPPMAHEQTA